jgi:hypothetical protein
MASAGAGPGGSLRLETGTPSRQALSTRDETIASVLWQGVRDIDEAPVPQRVTSSSMIGWL